MNFFDNTIIVIIDKYKFVIIIFFLNLSSVIFNNNSWSSDVLNEIKIYI